MRKGKYRDRDYRIIIVNEATGEVLEKGWVARVQGVSPDDNPHIRLNIKATEFRNVNIRVEKAKRKTQTESSIDTATETQKKNADTNTLGFTQNPIDATFGPPVPISQRRRFTKLYQVKPATFSKNSYRAYWYSLICHLEQETNIVYRRDRKGKLRRVQTLKELAEVCQAKERTFRDFYHEAKKKRYLARYPGPSGGVFVVNPSYAYNGNQMPQKLYELFQSK